jgi:hypothetical protein
MAEWMGHKNDPDGQPGGDDNANQDACRPYAPYFLGRRWLLRAVVCFQL